MSQPVIDPHRLATWEDRSPSLAAMLNPALITAVLAIAAQEYAGRRDDHLPTAYAFLILPLVLHRGTRERLPRTIASHWANWVSDNPVLMAGFPARAIELREHVREGLRFGLRHGILAVDEVGGLVAVDDPVVVPPKTSRGDFRELMVASQRLGRWLTKLDRPATAFALLGVRP